ncbi:MAG TPA: DUF3829 domain-containing protein [Polyangiaceae bacterium]|jgi:hypothetical protein|nr:DUF3829 domain-containing protein [Polyangiaceae bacterium]
MKLKNFSIVLGTGFVLAATTSGCKKLEELSGAASAVSGAVAAAAAGGGENAEEDKDNDLSNKLGKYIDCLNRVSPDVSKSRERYDEWVDEKTGPTGKEQNVYGLYEIYGLETCTKGIDEAKALKPALPEIEAGAEEWKTVVADIAKQTKAAKDYYDQGNYKDDQFAKGKAMHGPLIAAFTKFKTINDKLDEQVTKLNDEVALRRLGRLEKDPEAKFEYLYAKSLHEAKGLIKYTDIESIDKLAAEPYATQLTALEKAIGDLDTYVDSHKEEADKVSGMSSFINRMKEYLKASKDLQRRKRDNKDFAKENPPAGMWDHVEGHPAQIIDKYNDMIEASNSTRF